MPPFAKTFSGRSSVTLTREQDEKVNHLVKTLVKYTLIYDAAIHFLQTDPTKRDKMFKELADNPLTMKTFEPHKVEDVDGMLLQYDEALASDPVTFEDHFFRLHYAYMALILFNERVVYPQLLNNQGLFAVFQERLAAINRQSATAAQLAVSTQLGLEDPVACTHTNVSSSSQSHSGGEKVTQELARQLADDHPKLLKCRFLMNPEPDDVAADYWKVGTITLSGEAETSYVVFFTECDGGLPMEQEELIRLMIDSTIVDKE